jgi:hypothetical protein
MTKLATAAGFIFALWLHVHLTEQAYNTGYEDAEMALGTTAEQCFAWWFGPNIKQHEHELRQFCKRSGT